MSGLFVWDVGLKVGELIGEWTAVLTIPQMGHPGFGGKAMEVQRKQANRPSKPNSASFFLSPHPSSLEGSTNPAQAMSEIGSGLRSKPEIQCLFDTLRSQLDDFQDTREKLVKVHTHSTPTTFNQSPDRSSPLLRPIAMSRTTPRNSSFFSIVP